MHMAPTAIDRPLFIKAIPLEYSAKKIVRPKTNIQRSFAARITQTDDFSLNPGCLNRSPRCGNVIGRDAKGACDMSILMKTTVCSMVLTLVMGAADVRAACNEAVIAQQIQQRWLAPLKQAENSICSTAKVMIQMLTEVKGTINGCYTGPTKPGMLQELSQKISEWEGTKNSVCR